MQNTKLMLSSLTLVGLFALAGCSFPGVYKVDIQQGNVVTQDMIDQLRPGMTRSQVRFIMGSPLITDTFHASRWDYLYSIQPGGGQRQQERVSLVFNESDQLAGLAGDFLPGVSRDEAILGAQPTTTEPQQPAAEDERPGQARCSSRFKVTSMPQSRYRCPSRNRWKPTDKRVTSSPVERAPHLIPQPPRPCSSPPWRRAACAPLSGRRSRVGKSPPARPLPALAHPAWPLPCRKSPAGRSQDPVRENAHPCPTAPLPHAPSCPAARSVG